MQILKESIAKNTLKFVISDNLKNKVVRKTASVDGFSSPKLEVIILTRVFLIAKEPTFYLLKKPDKAVRVFSNGYTKG